MERDILRYRDPATGAIPPGIRELELRHAARLPSPGKNAATWTARGPFNVGGRTRGLAFDAGYNGTTNRKLMAGGVSGGMFLSEDNGATWQLTSAIDEFASVTSVAQDPNNPSIWYHGTGEFSNSIRGAFYLGQGVYKSTNGGTSWARLPGLNQSGSLTAFDDPLDLVWEVAVHPTNSVVLVAHVNGVSRSTDGGQTWSFRLSPEQNGKTAFYTDLDVAANGTVWATMSRNGTGNTEYGVYRSTDVGNTWTKLTVPGLVADPYRMVLATAPSDANVVYLLVQANAQGAKTDDHQLFRFDGTTWTDLSATLPKVTAPDGQGNPPQVSAAQFSSQGGYDLVVRVKPNDANAVWIGGVVLYRSTNGGSAWERVGGYASPYNFQGYEKHHSDQHALVFAPNDPNTLLSGHDGGLSLTSNALQSPQAWTSLNNGYVTSQFYAIAMDPQAGSDLLVGGTQDNGTWLAQSADGAQPWLEVFGGDGAFTAVAPGGGALYVSAQNADVFRIRAGAQQATYSNVTPATLPNPPFIAPLVLDPNDARVMYLASGNAVSRNSNLDGIAEGNAQRTDQNWTQLTGSAVGSAQTHQVTAVAISKTPANRLVFATGSQTETRVIRVDNPASNGSGTDVTPPFGSQNPVNVSSIALNPQNADEMIVVASNYRVKSLWHTTNGGQSWTDIEGNLGGDDGPSIRWAAIQPLNGSTVFALATSTGVYTSTGVSGSNTTWAREGDGTIGTVVTDMVVTRGDGTIVAATHGRGVYSATLSGGGSGQAIAATNPSRVDLGVRPGTMRSATLDVENVGGAPLSFTAQAACAQPGTPGAVSGRMSAFLTAPRKLVLGRGSASGSARAAGAARVGGAGSAKTRPNTVLVLDDGNETPDDFIGYSNNTTIYYNRFTVGTSAFTFEGVDFFMRTEGNVQNSVSVTLYDASGNELRSGSTGIEASPDGKWHSITSEPAAFEPGASFFVEIAAPFGIQRPAGADKNAQTAGRSFYYDFNTFSYQSIATVAGFENGAWLIRAVGTQASAQNQSPQAVAAVGAAGGQGTVGTPISFDASGSNDPDGQIVSYKWTFGDGQTSAQSVTTHTYTAAGTYSIALEVTDDKGATGSVAGQLTISAGQSAPCPLTVSPASGTVAAGASQALTVTYDAASAAEGTYTGTISIGGNGGTLSVPVAVTVSTSVAADEPTALRARADVLPNQPNPFSATTRIPIVMPRSADARVTVYDARGRRVRTLADGRFGEGLTPLTWDGRDDSGSLLPSGVYFVRLEPNQGLAVTRRIVKVQ